MTNSKSIGNRGETIAQNYLKQQGCKIINTNVYSRYGEIDIIALAPKDKKSILSEETLLFIEVKYRKNERFSQATTSITPAKQIKMRLTIESYLQQNPTDRPLRIDLITIIGNEPYKIHWLKNIF